MAYEWVAPVATATTGIAGIAGTWLTGRSAGRTQVTLLREEHSRERESETRKERRESFASMLDVLGAVEQIIQHAGVISNRMADRLTERNPEALAAALDETEFVSGNVP